MNDKLQFIDDLEEIYNVFDKNVTDAQIFVAKRLILAKIHKLKKDIEAFERAHETTKDPIPKNLGRHRNYYDQVMTDIDRGIGLNNEEKKNAK